MKIIHLIRLVVVFSLNATIAQQLAFPTAEGYGAYSIGGLDGQVVEVKWDGGKHDWGYRGLVALETPSNKPCVALLEIIK
ncbi:hypothetical protein [Flavisericum labens]|uniref:hypothetical protein n=1 Tax=Flavisericum labens TaxID=3377112 RepID=UPI00387ACBD6